MIIYRSQDTNEKLNQGVIMRCYLIEEWYGGKRIPDVEFRLNCYFEAYALVFGEIENSKREISRAVDITKLEGKIVFQDLQERVCKFYIGNTIYKYFSFKLDDSSYILFNVGLTTLKYRREVCE